MKTLLSKESIKSNILLVAIWGAVIITGFLALGAIVGNIEGWVVFGGIHSLAVRLGLVYTAIHVFQHREQIMSRFGIKGDINKQGEQVKIESQSIKTNRSLKVIAAVVFHVVLHIISIHLAVAYTVFHVIQHRQGITSLFKKKAFRQNAYQMQSKQALPLVA